MKKILLFLIPLVLTVIYTHPANAYSDEVIEVKSSDAEMNKAISTAKKSLPHFWDIYNNHKYGETNFALKVRIQDSKGNGEHLWTNSIRKENGKIFGIINNTPELVNTVHLGQEIEIKEKDISDWIYIKNEKVYGGFTIRVMEKRMAKDEAENIKAQLSDKPY